MTAFSATAEFGTAESPRSGLSLSCSSAAFSVVGLAAQAARAVASAAYSIAAISTAGVIAFGGGSAAFAVSGKAVAAPINAPMTAAAFLLSGRSADMALATDRAIFALSANAAAFPIVAPLAGRTFVLVGYGAQQAWLTPPAGFSLTGGAVADPSLVGLPASFAMNAKAAQLAMPVLAGAFSLQVVSSSAVINSVLASAPFLLFGKSVFRTWIIGLDVPGEPATAEFGTAEFPRRQLFQIAAARAVFSLTALDISTLLDARLALAAFALSGKAAEQAFPTATASYSLLGQSVRVSMVAVYDRANFALQPVAVGGQGGFISAGATFVTAGQDAIERISMSSAKASFVLTPQILILLQIPAASYAVSGQDAAGYPSALRAAFTLAGQNAFSVRIEQVPSLAFAVSVHPALTNLVHSLSRAGFNLLGWSVSDIIGPKGAHTYLIEAQAHDGTQLRTFYLSTAGFTSQPSDTPPNQYYDPRIIDPGNFERSLFDQTSLRGRAKSGSGDIVIASGDPGNGLVLDDWFNYGWSRREIRIKSLPQGAKSLSEASTLFVGKLDSISSTKPLDQLSLKIADRLGDLGQPLLTELFAGTTLASSPTAEGNADLKAKIKQQCWGTCANVPLQAANPYDLIYLASRAAVASIAVYDGGAALTYDGDSANISVLRAATIAGGHYRTCLAAGLVRVGALPEKALTADVVEGAAAAARTAGQIAYRMLIAYGVPSNAISTGSIVALDALNPAECCYFVDDDKDVISVVQDVLDSVGGWMIADRDGTLVFGRHGAPSTAPQTTFELDAVAIGDSLDMVDNEPPAWRILTEFAPVFTVQGDNDLLYTVSAERRAYLAKEFRTAAADAPSVKTKHLSAREITVRTYLTDATAAAAESARQLALLSAERRRFNIVMPLSDAWPSVPGNSVTLRNARLGLAGGKPFTVLKRVDQYQNDTVQFSLWG